ncbi:MAG: hypothetical protein EOO50_11845 [Flavobacterium sp.]|uniref:NUMOD4 domain-containing protein n=1 Tax=Flavobacterium sp. TaxID=239 RepID=UPI0011FEC1D2|nr:NUMOD4 domain-containing protein [Flavobacterium sp.]RZJ65951.1 MAG: hypothetical protein EOO50_11845 [Flavobacterium sp.]
MLRLYASETFKEITIDAPLRMRYAISNYGRLMSFTESIEKGTLLKGGQSNGYRILPYKMNVDGKIKNKIIFIYKLVGELFLPPPTEDQVHLIHLDRTTDNDNVKNLKWVTKDEFLEFYKNSPRVKAGKIKGMAQRMKSDGHKLTITQVMRLKKELANPNRKTRMKILAKRFGVSEMQLYRIKRGENWGHIQV